MNLARNKPLRRTGFIRRTTPLARTARNRRAIKTAAERRHIARVAAMPCLVCGERATVHHVTASIEGGRLARSHRRVVPLAPRFHLIQHGPHESVEALGHRGFFLVHGIDLLAVSDRLWMDSVQLESAR